jgi:ankyrin repeat protein
MTSILTLLKTLINHAKASLNKGVNAKDECGRTALMRAAHHGSADNVKTLLDMGADVNASDLWDVTALTMATAQGRDDIVLLLREAGAKE